MLRMLNCITVSTCLGNKLPTYILFSNHKISFISNARRPTTSSNSLLTRASFCGTPANGLLAAAFFLTVGTTELPQDSETLSNIPQTLSGDCAMVQDCKKGRIQHPKSQKAEKCVGKCVTTCIQGGYGSPGEGPFNVRRPLVVFKDTFRSRRYCLVECSDICNLIKDGDDGP
ncbi:hypothetical protein RJ641_020360 [Dillenia turbinata]|uniref:Uncharacterized protein n=1 Tax=Dillenia turbinata TaxID=194707 RepID=A0AAN8YZI5_9MAGN